MKNEEQEKVLHHPLPANTPFCCVSMDTLADVQCPCGYAGHAAPTSGAMEG